jgi:hypothetical protein
MMMSAKKRLYLFNNGDENIAITGGWRQYGFFKHNYDKATISKENGTLLLSLPARTKASLTLSTASKIDLRGYSKMCFEFASETSFFYAQHGMVVAILSKNIKNANDDYNNAFGQDSISFGQPIGVWNFTQGMTSEDLEQPRQVALCIDCWHISFLGATLSVRKIWLE